MTGVIIGVVIIAVTGLLFYIAMDGPFLLRDWRNRRKKTVTDGQS
jgi:hypothetical protein